MDMEAEHQVNPVDAGIFYKTRTQLQLSEAQGNGHAYQRNHAYWPSPRLCRL